MDLMHWRHPAAILEKIGDETIKRTDLYAQRTVLANEQPPFDLFM